jgi:uncharacterized protein YndB with AHSA1/START domain
MNDKQGILIALREEFNRWEALLASLSEEQITAPQLAENWSIKDVIAHLRAWQQRSIARLEAALLSRAPEYPAWPAQFDPEAEGQPHDLNAWLYTTYRDQPWSSVHRDWSQGFLRFLELGEAIPEKDLLDAGRYNWLEGYALFAVLQGSYEHHREHAEYLEPVIARLRQLTQVPIAKTGMLIRKPVADVFQAFINPDITTKFWFTKSSDRLEVGKQVQWDWEMYGVSAPVTVKAIEPNKRIVIEWPGYSGLSTVEWMFAPQKDGTTFVTIREAGFRGDGDELVKQVAASTQGFTLVLAGLKALLEHNVRLNLVADRFPKGIEEH